MTTHPHQIWKDNLKVNFKSAIPSAFKENVNCECNRINRILWQISVRLIRLRSIDSAIVQSIEPIERGQSIERNRTHSHTIYYVKSSTNLTQRCKQRMSRDFTYQKKKDGGEKPIKKSHL